MSRVSTLLIPTVFSTEVQAHLQLMNTIPYTALCLYKHACKYVRGSIRKKTGKNNAGSLFRFYSFFPFFFF